MRFEEPDTDRLVELYKRLEFNSFLKKMKGKKETDAGTRKERKQEEREQPDISAFPFLCPVSEKTDIVRAETEEELHHMSEALSGKETVWLKVFHDNSHILPPEISSVCLASEDSMYFIRWSEEKAPLLAEFFRGFQGRICGHDLKPDYYALLCARAAEVREERGFAFETGFDTAVAEYVLEPQKSSYGLSQLMLEYFHEEFPTDKELTEEMSVIDMFGEIYEKQAQAGLRILAASSKIAALQAERLAAEQLSSVLQDIELPLIEVLADMEKNGIRVDAEELETIGDFLKEKISEVTEKIYDAAGEEFNINSPKQLGAVLFEKLKLPPGKKTKSGYSTNAEVLERLAQDYPIAEQVLEFRMLTKLNGTYVEGMLPLIDSRGKIHAHFQQTVTATGRLSCTEPNLQNIPVRQELGRMLRKVFTASDEEHILVGADYSQIELRIMAHLSEDPALIESFENGKDIHQSTAARVFDVAPEDVTPLQRSRAKAVNFGVIYGISAFGLSSDLKISRKEAQQYIDDYFRKHPKVKEYMDRMVEECRENGFVTTMSGRRRKINEIHASNYMTRQLGERLAMNTPVQGTAADIMKLAMTEAYRRLGREIPEARVILQVHDELILDVPVSVKEQAMEVLKESMCGAAQLKVPLVAEVSAGNDWYSVK